MRTASGHWLPKLGRKRHSVSTPVTLPQKDPGNRSMQPGICERQHRLPPDRSVGERRLRQPGYIAVRIGVGSCCPLAEFCASFSGSRRLRFNARRRLRPQTRADQVSLQGYRTAVNNFYDLTSTFFLSNSDEPDCREEIFSGPLFAVLNVISKCGSIGKGAP